MSSTTPGRSGSALQPGLLRRHQGLAVTSAGVVVGVGALIGLTVWSQYDGQGATGLFTVDVVVGAASCCLLPVLLRWPVPGAFALAVLSAVSPAVTPAATFGALHVSLRRPFGVAAGVAAIGIAAQLSRNLWRPLTGLSFGWWALLVVAAYAALVGWGAWNKAHIRWWHHCGSVPRAAEAEQGRG